MIKADRLAIETYSSYDGNTYQEERLMERVEFFVCVAGAVL
jgi:hypothetical protein